MQIVVWHNEKKNDYYYKILHNFSYKKYYMGYKNQYDHEVVLVIENICFKKNKTKLKNRVLTILISFLQKINK